MSYEIVNAVILILIVIDNIFFAKKRYMHWVVALIVDRSIEDHKCVVCQHPTSHDELLGVKKTIGIIGKQ